MVVTSLKSHLSTWKNPQPSCNLENPDQTNNFVIQLQHTSVKIKSKAHVENGTDKRVKALQTDRGGEFYSQEFKTFCEENGIARKYTAPYSPQQNGVVERKNRTMVAMA